MVGMKQVDIFREPQDVAIGHQCDLHGVVAGKIAKAVKAESSSGRTAWRS